MVVRLMMRRRNHLLRPLWQGCRRVRRPPLSRSTPPPRSRPSPARWRHSPVPHPLLLRRLQHRKDEEKKDGHPSPSRLCPNARSDKCIFSSIASHPHRLIVLLWRLALSAGTTHPLARWRRRQPSRPTSSCPDCSSVRIGQGPSSVAMSSVAMFRPS